MKPRAAYVLALFGLSLLGARLFWAWSGDDGPSAANKNLAAAGDPRWDTALSEYGLGQQSADEYRFQEAIEHWTRTVDLVAALGWPPERTHEVQDVRLRRGTAYHHMGAYARAESDLIGYSAHFPDDRRASYILAAVRRENGK